MLVKARAVAPEADTRAPETRAGIPVSAVMDENTDAEK